MKREITEKKIQSHLNEVQSEIEAEKAILAAKQRELAEKEKTAASLKKKLKGLSQGPPRITEHAICRYFQRVKGEDLEAIKQSILHPEVLKLVEVLGGNGTYPHPDGFSIKMRNNAVLTITK